MIKKFDAAFFYVSDLEKFKTLEGMGHMFVYGSSVREIIEQVRFWSGNKNTDYILSDDGTIVDEDDYLQTMNNNMSIYVIPNKYYLHILYNFIKPYPYDSISIVSQLF